MFDLEKYFFHFKQLFLTFFHMKRQEKFKRCSGIPLSWPLTVWLICHFSHSWSEQLWCNKIPFMQHEFKQAKYVMDICIEHLPLVNEYVKNEKYLLKCTKLLKRKIEFIQNLLTVTRTWCSVIVTFSVCLTKIKLFWKGSC